MKFSQVFYNYLFIKKYSVCKAYELSKEDIRSCINQVEANKFILYVNENNKKNRHVCFPITKFKEGSLTKIGDVPLFDEIESSIDKFKGRQQEMHEILFLLQNNRIVNILGTPGIGKTCLVRNL